MSMRPITRDAHQNAWGPNAQIDEWLKKSKAQTTGAPLTERVAWGGYLAPGLEKGNKLTDADYFKLREFDNQDVFDTLNKPAMDAMLKPPLEWDPSWMLNVNKTLVTLVLTLESQNKALGMQLSDLKKHM